ncbi:MAG: hypothetical protein HYI21_03830 [Sediminibacterium sp. Gen4]|jgi:hypothetical protein|uniref:hypothetical protein n=1 Tax=unclassified Sediminibacterium TaxID=2635961 RepID=UPI0015BBA018|nr:MULTISPECIES: hypothetical protein [unclassified Sediminibacterium]MBW0161795.1 hypothetical protein [Sediminibacterium sp.]MBW0165346.1 hypothetical protein [Sediminibacterium sp.]NWK65135.1 hypothetical protein [Sediminibacterium sp. Gen4]
MHLSILFFLILFSNTVVHAQQDTVVWNTGAELKWSDFKGIPDKQSHYEALTHAEIRYAVTFIKGLAKFNFSNIFLKKASWTKNNTNLDLLQHEQIHFDIAELHKRLLIGLLYTRDFRKHNFEKEVKQLGDSINTARNRMDEQFDQDVLHINDRNRLVKWQTKINKELDRLKSYDRNSILVKLID